MLAVIVRNGLVFVCHMGLALEFSKGMLCIHRLWGVEYPAAHAVPQGDCCCKVCLCWLATNHSSSRNLLCCAVVDRDTTLFLGLCTI